MSEKPKVHPIQRAWAAGVFDARVKIPKAGAVLRFETADEPLIRRFHETCGVGRVFEREKERCVRPIWVFQTSSMDDSRSLLLFVSPLMTGGRINQVAEMVARIERNPVWRKNNPEKASSLDTENAAT